METPKRYGFTAKFRAMPGKADALAAILLEAASGVAAAKGVQLYAVGRDPKDENLIHVMEIWDSKEDHDQSLTLPDTRELNEHLSVYSLRYYELLLRASTEFEGTCKDKLIELNLCDADPKNFKIKHYHLLAEPLELSQYAVIYNFQPLYGIEPFSEWKISPLLSWYQEYNTVKHNRNSEFKRANLANVLNSIAAVFIVITKGGLCPIGQSNGLNPTAWFQLLTIET